MLGNNLKARRSVPPPPSPSFYWRIFFKYRDRDTQVKNQLLSYFRRSEILYVHFVLINRCSVGTFLSSPTHPQTQKTAWVALSISQLRKWKIIFLSLGMRLIFTPSILINPIAPMGGIFTLPQGHVSKNAACFLAAFCLWASYYPPHL